MDAKVLIVALSPKIPSFSFFDNGELFLSAAQSRLAFQTLECCLRPAFFVCSLLRNPTFGVGRFLRLWPAQ